MSLLASKAVADSDSAQLPYAAAMVESEDPALISGDDAAYADWSGGALFVDGVSAQDVVQENGTNDCYFLASLASLAQQSPSSVEDMIQDQGGGSYAVRFYACTGSSKDDMKSEPVWVTVDSDLPTRDGSLAYGHSEGVSDSGQTELWVSIVEKAFVRFAATEGYIENWWLTIAPDEIEGESTDDSGYDAAQRGRATFALFTLLGEATLKSGDTTETSRLTGRDEQWAKLTAAIDAGDVVVADNKGPFVYHSVSVLGYREDGGDREVKIRNQQDQDADAREEWVGFASFLWKYEYWYNAPVTTGGSSTVDVSDEVSGATTRLGLARTVLVAKGESSMGTASSDQVGERAVAVGIFDAAPDLRLGDTVNRAEAAKMVCSAFNLDTCPSEQVRRTFPDLPPTHWSAPYVYGAVKSGVLQGYPDGTFRPASSMEYVYIDDFVAKAASPDPSQAVFDPTVEGSGRSDISGGALGSTSGRAGSLDTSGMTTRDATASAEDRVAQANSIINKLNAEGSARYQASGEGESLQTFCNVYGHDYAELMGAFLPRVWWYDHIIDQYGLDALPAAVYGVTVRELTANQLYDWLDRWGSHFGWSQLGTTDSTGLTAAQDAANEGLVVMISANTGSSASGHVTAVVPETDTAKAVRDDDGQVKVPVQSQAGAANENRGTDSGDWWNNYMRGYPGGKAIWVHA